MKLCRAARPECQVLLVSDLHVGSTVGLWPGRHRVEGGGTYEANTYQQWLYRCWLKLLEEARGMGRPIVILNGDAIQGVNTRDGQLVTNNIDAQVSAALTLLKPLREAAGVFYLIRGTEWHEGKASEFLGSLGDQLHAVIDPDTGQSTWWELYLDLDGPVIHCAHHVGISSVPWYEATVPLRDTLLQLSELWRFYGRSAPNLRMVVRSHRHRYIHVEAPPDIHVVVTPAFQLKTAFMHKRSSSLLPQVGYVRIDTADGELMVRSRIFEPPPIHVEQRRER